MKSKYLEKVSGISTAVKNSDNLSFLADDQKDRIEIEYFINKKNGHVFAKVIFGRKAQGPPNHAHGGAIAAVLDEAMGVATWLNGHPSMTIKLTVEFVNALPLDIETIVETWIDKIDGKKIKVIGKIKENNGKIFAKSEGLFLKQSAKQLKKFGDVPEKLIQYKSDPKYYNTD